MNKTYKVYNYVIKKPLKSLSLVILISIVPIIIIFLIDRGISFFELEDIFKVFEGADILSYLGTIISIFLGAVATLSALDITIQFEKNGRKKERRLQVYPYLKYKVIVDKNYTKADLLKMTNSSNTIEADDIRIIEPFELDISADTDLVFFLEVENIGVGSVMNFSILESTLLHKEKTDRSIIDYIIVGEKKYIKFAIVTNIENKFNIHNNEFPGLTPLSMKIAYTNITGDYYEQDIIVDCSWSGREIKKLDYEARIDGKNVSTPCFFENKKIFGKI